MFGQRCQYAHGERCNDCQLFVLHPWDDVQARKHGETCRPVRSPVSSSTSPHHAEGGTATADPCAEQACSICLEPLLALQGTSTAGSSSGASSSYRSPPRFGLLPNCAHVFCLSCITDWRASHNTDDPTDFTQPAAAPKSTVRSCPNCRVLSYFVIPSAVLPVSDAHRLQIIEQYKQTRMAIPCKCMVVVVVHCE